MRVEKLKRANMQREMIDRNTEIKAPRSEGSHSVTMSDPSIPEWQKKRNLAQIEAMREFHKGYAIE